MHRVVIIPVIFTFVLFTGFIMSITPEPTDTFKQQQKKNSRVKAAYTEKEDLLIKRLDSAGLKMSELNIMIVATKQEREFTVYVKKKTETTYKPFYTYNFCYLSGVLGPKRKEGDLQVPEGFYYVNWFNPNSDYHLSFKINYPNASDKILGDKLTPGGEIFVHGKCVSIGCIPLTDEFINEVYILALEATNNGQSKIPVYIFPFKMTEERMKLFEVLIFDPDLILFWRNLQSGWKKLESELKELKFTVDKKGNYVFS